MFLFRIILRILKIVFDTILFVVVAGLFIIALIMASAILLLVFF